MRLTDKYRPKTLDEVIGHEKVVSKIKRVISRPGFDRGAFWVSGRSGIGKTSIARAIGGELGADPQDVFEFDGDAFDASRVRQLKDICRLHPLGRFRLVIVNEAHAITTRAVQALLTLLQEPTAGNESGLPPKTVFVFTTTESGDDLFGNFSSPLFSRCYPVRLSAEGLGVPFARHARAIAQTEGLNGKAESYYVNLVKRHRNNLRAVLAEIEFEG